MHTPTGHRDAHCPTETDARITGQKRKNNECEKVTCDQGERPSVCNCTRELDATPSCCNSSYVMIRKLSFLPGTFVRKISLGRTV
eukprot:1369981-Amphidinium_carterae.1